MLDKVGKAIKVNLSGFLKNKLYNGSTFSGFVSIF